MPKPRIVRVPPHKNPPRYPVESLFDITVPNRHSPVALLPSARLTIATPFVCRSCKGSRHDWGEQFRSQDACENPVSIIPCRTCCGTGAILPGESLWIDIAGVQHKLQTGNTVVSTVFRVRSPWANSGTEGYKYVPFVYAGIESPATSTAEFRARLYDRIHELMARREADGYSRFSASRVEFEHAVYWPNGWKYGDPHPLDWMWFSLQELDMS